MKYLKIIKWAALLIIASGLAAAGFLVALTAFYPIRHVEIIRENAARFDLPEELIFAVIHTESRFREEAVSRVGARGLMQLMPDTAYWAAEQSGLEDFSIDIVNNPSVNIALGCWFLSWLFARFDGELNTVLAAYNAGNGRVAGWLANPEFSEDGRTLAHIPFTETRNYVERVNNAMNVYRMLLRIFNRFV